MAKDVSTSKGARKLFIFGVVIIVFSVVAIVILFINRKMSLANEAKVRVAAVQAGIGVQVVSAHRSPGERTITLTGEAQPFATVTLYAKISGYLKEIRVDKGDRVTAGEVLAIIESPELDRQYESAAVDAQDKRRDATREKILVEKNLISQQDSDHAEAAAHESEANAEALKTQKEYEILRAPFPAS